ncbi:aminopeptidase P family protein [Campylobacter sp. CCS1377]|uniref:Aminopeptidase P family protein n=1 Tax=Campylobacter sp. CCS1377 TaxID=3158229 RepID=A0AAU7E9W3_9BACT
MNIYQTRLQILRHMMQKEDIDIYLILSTDPHLNEYIPDFYKIRVFMSGFNGSAGILVITQNQAFLWTDGRYFLQAQKELEGSTITLQKQDQNNHFLKWLQTLNFKQKLTLATDFTLLPLSLKQELNSQNNICLKHKDFISSFWQNRPLLSKNPIYEHEENFAYPTRLEKINLVREKMKKIKAQNHLISSLDDIAWITNLRGNDIEFNPVFYAYLFLNQNEILLFTDLEKIDFNLKNKLAKDFITLKNYEEIHTHLKTLKNTNLLIDETKMTALLMQDIDQSVEILNHTLPSTILKACKNSKEIANIEQAMLQDGIALCYFFAWLEEKLNKKEKLSELDIDIKITEFRARNPLYISNSFATIAGFNANSALPHYKATQSNFSYIEGNGLLLIDSGAQYKNGTTDITRVVPVGKVTAEQIKDYTLVLKAHINIASAVFPKDIAMPLLDSITRSILWKEQLDFAHGTGHGVGYFLNVHEGPQSLSYSATINDKNKAKIGMITSIEPGIYRNNQWGIRLENLVLNCKIENPKETNFGEFLYFKTLTLCPFERNCIDVNLLDEKEKQWLNSYHQEVYQKLSPYLNTKVSRWLKRKTQEI